LEYIILKNAERRLIFILFVINLETLYCAIKIAILTLLNLALPHAKAYAYIKLNEKY